MLKGNYWLRRKLKQKQRMSAGAFWTECGVKMISYLCALVIMTLVLSVTLPMTTEQITQIAEYSACALALLWCIPILRNTRYRLRDAGYSAKTYLWLLLPVIGWIVFIARLCAKSQQMTASEAERGIDSWYC